MLLILFIPLNLSAGQEKVISVVSMANNRNFAECKGFYDNLYTDLGDLEIKAWMIWRGADLWGTTEMEKLDEAPPLAADLKRRHKTAQKCALKIKHDSPPMQALFTFDVNGNGENHCHRFYASFANKLERLSIMTDAVVSAHQNIKDSDIGLLPELVKILDTKRCPVMPKNGVCIL